MKEGHFAFYCEDAIAAFVIPKLFRPHEFCDTKEILFRREDPVGMIVKKFSPLRERILIDWLWRNEVGVSNRILRHWRLNSLKCESGGYFDRVRLQYVTPIFGFLVCSYFLSIFILIIEILKKKYEN